VTARVGAGLLAGLEWVDGTAACAGHPLGADAWHPGPDTDADGAAAALAVCAACPLRGPCAAYAAARPGLPGIWGGTTPAQRGRAARPPAGGGCATCAAAHRLHGSGTASAQVADTLGLTPRALYDHLRGHGRPLPDGRSRPCAVCAAVDEMAGLHRSAPDAVAASGLSARSLARHLHRHGRPLPPGLPALVHAARKADGPPAPPAPPTAAPQPQPRPAPAPAARVSRAWAAAVRDQARRIQRTLPPTPAAVGAARLADAAGWHATGRRDPR